MSNMTPHFWLIVICLLACTFVKDGSAEKSAVFARIEVLLTVAANASFTRGYNTLSDNRHIRSLVDRKPDKQEGAHKEDSVAFNARAAPVDAAATNTSLEAAGHEGVHAPEILYIFLTLIFGALARYGLKMVRKWIVIPYTVVVLVLGIIYGILAQYTNSPAMTAYVNIATVDPDIILLVFLPGLIYEAAFSMQTHLFKKLFFHMLIIGTFGLAFNVASIGGLLYIMFSKECPEWKMNTSMLFSSVISANDPIAAVVLLKETGSARTLTTVLEGTALLSDTSAMILFNLLLQIADGNIINPSADNITESFFMSVLGGPAWGLAVGFVLTNVLSRMTSMWKAELLLILSVPYLVFWSADQLLVYQDTHNLQYMRVSGAAATMVLGLWMSAHRTCISPDVELLINRIWGLISLVSNTLVFSLVGILIVRLIAEGKDSMEAYNWIDLLVLNLFLVIVRALGFVLMKPILCRIGIGTKVFTWPNIFVLSWGSFKGAVTLALGMTLNEVAYFTAPQRANLRQKMLFNSTGVVAFTLLINASTMRFFLKRLGILDMPMSEMITMHMALKQILHTRYQKLDALKTDRYLTDADWQRVDNLTKIDGSRYGIEGDGETSLWTIHFVTREVSCPSCEAEVQLEPLPKELAEMEGIARLRLVNAKKISYWRQYEEGTLSQNGIKHLDDLSDTALSSENGVIGADDVKNCLHDELWTTLKKKIGRLMYWIEHQKSTIWTPPDAQWKKPLFHVATSPVFRNFMSFIIVCNLTETITDWVVVEKEKAECRANNQTMVLENAILLPLQCDFPDYYRDYVHPAVMYVNVFFAICYISEAVIKVIGLSWYAYWGNAWLSWNRLDLFLLLLTFVDVSFDFALQYIDAVTSAGTVTSVRVFRFAKLFRFHQVLRYFKPFVPKVLQLIDGRVNAHLFVAYDIAKAFMVAQEECSMMVPTVIGYKPLAAKFKTQADGDCRIVLKELGLLNEKRPDVAAAVKTRQAIRSILNHLHKSVEHMQTQGILDSHEVEHLQATIEARLKRLYHFPHTIAIVRPLERLWNVPWINGSKEVFDVMKILFEERQYEIAAQLMSADTDADGIYVLISGVISITYQRFYLDNPELGEIYNSDNLRTVTSEVLPYTEDSPRLDYLLAGGLMNEQSLALGFPRRSHAVSDTVVSLLYLNANSFFRAMATLPAMEARFWRKVATNVAQNVLIKLGSLTDTTFETDRIRLARAAVRLVRPGVQIVGLDAFEDVFLIVGTLTDITSADHDAIIGPRKVPAAYREVEVTQGRPAVTDEAGHVIYPEYAILFLVPHGNRDLSMVNIHDNETTMLDHPATDPNTLRNFVTTIITEKTGQAPTDAQLPTFLQHEVVRKQPLKPELQRRPVSSRDSRTTTDKDHIAGKIRAVWEKRDSNMSAMLQFAKSRQRDGSQGMFSALSYQQNNEPVSAANSSPLPIAIEAALANEPSPEKESQHHVKALDHPI